MRGRSHYAEEGTLKTNTRMNTTAVLVCFAFLFGGGILSYAQTSGTIRGSVADQSGALIAGATVEIQNPVSHYTEQVKTDSQGNFTFPNVPYNNYHVTASASGFAGTAQDVEVRSPVPVQMPKITLQVGAASSAVTVEAAPDLVETNPATHTDVDRGLFDKLPLESQSSSLSSLVTLASPGIAADSNGLFHGLGDHASNSFSLDGQPITDQQSKVFSNQIPLDAVQSMEVIEGAPPAEYGDKTSVVIVVTTRSGLGHDQPHGDVTASFGTFGTTNGGVDLGFGGKKLGNFISANGLDTGRFLDGPEFQVYARSWQRGEPVRPLRFQAFRHDTFSLNFRFTRSWFQTPNTYDAQTATAWSGPVCMNYLSYSNACNGLGPNGQVVGPTDQRSKIRTFNIAPTWTRLVNPNTVFTFGGFARQDQYNYYPSADPFADLIPDLQLQTIGQNRRLTDLGLRTSVSYIKGKHNIEGGSHLLGHDSHGKRHFRNRRSDGEPGLPESGRKSRPGSDPDQSGELHRGAASRIRTSIPCWRVTT